MIRDALVTDAPKIKNLVNNFASNGTMLRVSMNDIYERLLEYKVYEVDGEIVGVSALHPMWEFTAEIRSLAISEVYQGKGIGKQLVLAQIEKARKVGFLKVFVLTYKHAFFENLGFQVVSIDTLPKKIWTDCLKCVKFPNCDEIAMEKNI